MIGFLSDSNHLKPSMPALNKRRPVYYVFSALSLHYCMKTHEQKAIPLIALGDDKKESEQ